MKYSFYNGGCEELVSSAEACPGIKKFLRPSPEYFPCPSPSCNGSVEIWSDENVGVCDTCEKEFGRPEKETSCLEWCEFADRCREIIKNKKH